MKRKILFFTFCLLSSFCIVCAHEEDLIMQFDFKNVNGSNVKDDISGITAITYGAAKVTTMGQYNVLDLGNATGYLDMTAAAGNLLKAMNDYSVSVYYMVSEEASLSGNGYFLWSFATSTAVSASDGKYSAYRLNAQRFASSNGGYNNETAIQTGSASKKGKWIHVAYTEQEGKGTLYINGESVGTKTGMNQNVTNFSSSTVSYCWIGRAPFSGDNYLKQTLVTDFRLYKTTLTANQITTLAAKTAELEEAMLHGGGGDNTTLLNTIKEANALITDDYPQEAVTTLHDVIKICSNIANTNSSQLIYDKYNALLKKASSTYKTKKGKTFDTSGITTSKYNTNRGFIHPGMLHTASDFERVRQQLKDGNAKVTEAYNILKSAAYAQSNAATYPVETIVRGGGTGENYINAARGATIAYQNALRWRIEGNKACAKHAVEVLMAWANTCKYIGGNSNWALAAGLYGYQFANAAELVRDYEGWSEEDFETFKRWMIDLWYSRAIGFLRNRNGTWENAGRWGECPGHYWSNWGLCNALCVISVGILCDDVFIYNQGMSFFKYDQVGTFVNPRTANPILNDGLTEFLGNLVVTTSEWEGETEAYGQVGQMQESGRDVGHATMALGLAIDIAQTGWNQGDDLFSYMDHRLAAGIEFVAAQQKGITDLPWTTYHYAESGLAWWDSRSWKQESYATGEQIRPYWGTVIGHYEGIKGVKMPFSEWAYDKMGIDAGGMGSTSGGYDHLGYSVLMNTRPFATEEIRQTELKPLMKIDGKSLTQSDLGGLKNHWRNTGTETVEKGKQLVLTVVLPDGEEDTGMWQWNTGETTRSITINADHSYVYRATYTNKNGVESHQSFSIAVTGDCNESKLEFSKTINEQSSTETEGAAFFGESIAFTAYTVSGWDNTLWNDGTDVAKTEIPSLGSERIIQAIVTNQGGRQHLVSFNIRPIYTRPDIVVNGVTKENQSVYVTTGSDEIILQPYIPSALGEPIFEWSDGSHNATLTVNGINTSNIYTVRIYNDLFDESLTYNTYIKDETVTQPIESGIYLIRNAVNGTYMTNKGINQPVCFEEGNPESATPEQIWEITAGTSDKYSIKEIGKTSGLNTNGMVASRASNFFHFDKAIGLDRYAIYTKVGTTIKYWGVKTDGTTSQSANNAAIDFPFEFIAVEAPTAIDIIVAEEETSHTIYDLQGRRLFAIPQKGIYIKDGKKYIK